MAKITIQVLEGLERGRVFDSLDTPVTIGREDDNSIQLNDERVSGSFSPISTAQTAHGSMGGPSNSES